MRQVMIRSRQVDLFLPALGCHSYPESGQLRGGAYHSAHFRLASQPQVTENLYSTYYWSRTNQVYSRQDCLRIALRVMAFFTRLVSTPPSAEDITALKHCAEPEDKAKPLDELARIVIDKKIVEN